MEQKRPFSPIKAPYNPWDIKDPEVDALAMLQKQQIEQQQRLFQAQQGNIGATAGFNPMENLAPLVGLTDSWTGSNFSRAYQAPESGAQRLSKVQALEQGLAAQQNALTDNQMNQLRAALQEKKADRTQQQQYLMHLESLQNARDLKAMEINAASKKEGTKEPNQNQYQAAGFAKRARAATEIMHNIQQAGFDPTSGEAALQSVLYPPGYQDENVKLNDQAALDFITAVLRKESGASISDEEFKREKKKYIPQWGDTEAVLKQKADAR